MTLDDEDIQAIAERLATLLGQPRALPRLADAARMAEILDVDRSWVYRHAEQLGALRLRADDGMLRFDIDHVLDLLRQPPPQATPPRPARRRGGRRRRSQREVSGLELIDYQS